MVALYKAVRYIPRMEFNELLREQRKLRLLTQTQAANLVGVEQGAFSDWERGRRRPDGRNVATVSDTFSIPISIIRPDWFPPSEAA